MHDKLDTWSRWEWGVNSDGPLIWLAGRYLSILQWTELSEASSNRNIDQLSHAEHKQMLRIIYWNFSLDQIITRWVFFLAFYAIQIFFCLLLLYCGPFESLCSMHYFGSDFLFLHWSYSQIHSCTCLKWWILVLTKMT